jgi:hypothetical protein
MSKKPKPPHHRELEFVADAFGIHEEVDGTSDRAAAIVALAYVENNLVLAIMTRLLCHPLRARYKTNTSATILD